jgi:hypothetical protein
MFEKHSCILKGLNRPALLILALLIVPALGCGSPKTPRQLSNAVNFNVHYTETVKVTTEPPGAHVFVDDQFVGRTPADVDLVVPQMRVKWPYKLGTGYYGSLLVDNAGKPRVMEILALGYQPTRTEIDLKQSQSLNQLLAQYQADAETDPNRAKNLVPKEMKAASKQHVNLAPMRVATRTVEPPREMDASTGPTLGKVTITTRMTGAEIRVNGQFMGNTPAVLPLPAGTHRIQVMSAGLTPYVQEIQVQAGAAMTVRADFKRTGDYQY